MGRSSLRAVGVLLVAFVVADGALATRAHACGNSYTQYYVLGGARTALDNAERALSRGSIFEAGNAANQVATIAEHSSPVLTITRAMRDANESAAPLPRWSVNVNDEAYSGAAPRAANTADAGALLLRARMLRGIAVARMNGQLNSRFVQLRRASAAQRDARFVAAIADLTAVLAANPTDPRAQAYLAEIQARRDPSGAPAALSTLRSLAQRDVLPDAWSWAMLARLESDPAARAQALQRCTALAGSNATRACVP